MRTTAIPILLAISLMAASTLSLACKPRRAPDAPRPDYRTILRVSNWGGPSVDPAFMAVERDILRKFEDQHPNLTVQIENIPGPTNQCYVPKLLMTFVAGNPPDVISLDASSAAVFINHNLLTDLTPFVDADKPYRLDDYFPTALSIARRGPQLFAIPLDFTPMVILYNRKLFRDAGLPDPKPAWTRDEFLAAARKLSLPPTSTAPARYGFFFQKEMSLWFPWIIAAGADVLSPDAKHAVGYLDSPQTIEIIQFLVDLIKKHKAANELSQSATAGLDLFRAGRAAMTMTGHWMLIEYRADKLDIGVASIPSSPGQRATVMYEAGLGISNTSPRKQLAWDYIKYMTSPEVQRRRVATGIAISGNTLAARSFAGNPVEDAFLEEVKFARPPWGARCERYELVEDLGREMIEDVLNGNVPVQDAVARTARLVERQLTREK